jgi:Zn-dependent metalloprotease
VGLDRGRRVAARLSAGGGAMAHRRHCVVPSYILEHIARTGTDGQREAALRTLGRDAVVRRARLRNAAVRAGGPREGADALAALTAVPGPQRTITDAQHGDDVTAGPVVRREGDPPTGDPAADEAYDGFGSVHDFYAAVFSRNSIDDEGMPLRGVVHFGHAYDNAFWDGRRMVFGDGDGELFLRFTRSLDVIGHELGHGVIEDEAALEYAGQSGALNEHWADVSGTMVRQRTLGQDVTQADWLIGAELLAPGVHGVALRSLKAPGTAYDDPRLGRDPQPAHMSGYVRTLDDDGGVHINSGIPNKAFYEVASALGGHVWERAGRIWYETLRHPALRPTATFSQFARLTRDVARALYGEGGAEPRAVLAGWDAVGLTVG